MRLNINLDTNKFVQKGGTDIPINNPVFVRGDKLILDIYFYEQGSEVSADIGTIPIVFGGKARTKFDGDYLFQTAIYSKETTGADTYYRFTLDLHTTQLNDALEVDAITTNDLSDLPVNIELQRTEGTLITSTTRQAATVQNDVNKGSEGAPSPGNPTYATSAALAAEVQNRLDGDAASINPANPVSFGNVVELVAQGFSNPAVAMRLSEALILFGERWYHPYKAIFFASDNTAGGGTQSPFPYLNCNSGNGAVTQTTGFRLLDLVGDKFKPETEPIVAEFTILDGTFTSYADLAVYLLVGSNKFDPRPPSSSEFGVGVKIFNNQVFLVSSDGSTLSMSAGVTRLSTLGQPQEYRIEVDGNAIRLFRRSSNYIWNLDITLSHPTVNPAPGGIHYGVSAMIHYEHNGGANNNRYLRIFDARVATVPKFLP